jgi:hypothetical protein
MQSGSGAHIIQPVLQWGPSAAGGGNYWAITNWYADGQGGAASFKPLIRVNPGDVVQGVKTCTGQSDSEYSYKSSFVGHPTADVTVSDVDQLTWASAATVASPPKVNPTMPDPNGSTTAHSSSSAKPTSLGYMANDRELPANRTSPRQQVQRDHPGSILSFASGNAIKRITAGVKTRR